MSKFDYLVGRYEQFCALPWERTLAAPQRVWFIVYDPADERRLRARLPEFELATKKAGHGWSHADVTDDFGHWIATHEYRQSFFESPEDVQPVLPAFENALAVRIRHIADVAEETGVVALSGIGCMFGLASVSKLIEAIAPAVKGRLLVFFPGVHEHNNYRLLDAKDGWNYLAVAITAHEGGEVR